MCAKGNNVEVMKEEIMHDVYWLMFWCFIAGYMAHYSFLNLTLKKKKKKRKSKLPKCDCSDVNQCDKLCHAKDCFNKDFQDGKI